MPSLEILRASDGLTSRETAFIWNVLPLGVANAISFLPPGNLLNRADDGAGFFRDQLQVLETAILHRGPAGGLQYLGYAAFIGVLAPDAEADSPYHVDIGGPALAAVGPALPGDYNQSSTVESADYTVWRNTIGQTGFTPFSEADGNDDGTIDTADYRVWKTNFRETLPPSSDSATANAFAELSIDVKGAVTSPAVATVASALTA